MSNNSSVVDGGSLMRHNGQLNDRIILVQVFVAIFLLINFLLIATFFLNNFFYTTMRYILFATTLLSDCLILIISNVLLIINYFRSTMQMWLCLILYILSILYTLVTPFTLMAMTLERYVAICMPLQHAELCSAHRALHCLLIIHSLSSIPFIVDLSIYFTSAPLNFHKQYRVCSVEVFIIHNWQIHLRSSIYQFYFLIMCITIVFSYVKIMKVAKAASGENKKSTWKGLRTVILHAFQLLLCLIQLWCPFIEAAVLKINLALYMNVRYFNYITFYIAPRCLSPLIYGLRDDKFFLALKYYALCGLYKKNSFHLTN